MTVHEEFAALFAVNPMHQSFRSLIKPKPMLNARHALPSGLAKAQGDPCLTCGVLIYLDEIDRAHDKIYDMGENAEASIWHGLVHRREGDFWNANHHLARATALCGELGIDSVGITERTETAFRTNPNSYPEELLEEIRREWRLLMDYGLRRVYPEAR